MRLFAKIGLLIALLAAPALAQFTTVTGTVVDPNGLPYSYGTIASGIVSSGTPKFTATGVPYIQPIQATGLDINGHFVVTLADNTQLTPGGSTWTFTVCSSGGTIQPAGGKGPVCFSPAGITISGASQDISAQLNAAALPLSASGGAATGTTNAANFPGTNWIAQVNAAATALTNGGTIIIPDSIAGDGHLTTGSIPSNVTLQFTGSATFKACTINVGQFTKIYNNAALIQLSGSGCIGINLTTQAIFQTNDKFILGGVRIDCNAQTNSTGIFLGGATTQVATYNVSVKNCSTADVQFDGNQFSENYNMNLGAATSTAALIIHSINPAGGGNSNTFYGLKVWTSGIGVLIYADTSIGQGANYFINPSILGSTTTGLCAFGNTFPTDVHWYGGAPENTGGGASTLTVNGKTCKQATIHANLADVVLTDISIADAVTDPWAIAENTSHITFLGGGGYGNTTGRLVQADSTSTTSFDGPYNHLGVAANVVAYPSTFEFKTFAKLYGAPILQYTTTVPNAYTGDANTPAVVDRAGASGGSTAVDPTYGVVDTVVYAASAGTRDTNRIYLNNVISNATSVTSDILVSILVKASVSMSLGIGDYNQNSSRNSPVSLIGGQWTRVVMFEGAVASGTGFLLVAYPNDSTGATVSFTGLEALARASNSSDQQQVMNTVLVSGAVNPNSGNCSAVGTAASPSIASCSVASIGMFSCATTAVSTCRVNTSAVTSNSEVFVQQRTDTTAGTRLGVTCNTTLSTVRPDVTAVVSGTSFDIGLTQPVTNPNCYEYRIDNANQ